MPSSTGRNERVYIPLGCAQAIWPCVHRVASSLIIDTLFTYICTRLKWMHNAGPNDAIIVWALGIFFMVLFFSISTNYCSFLGCSCVTTRQQPWNDTPTPPHWATGWITETGMTMTKQHTTHTQPHEPQVDRVRNDNNNNNEQLQQNDGTMTDNWEVTRMRETKWKKAQEMSTMSLGPQVCFFFSFLFSFHFHFTNKLFRY